MAELPLFSVWLIVFRLTNIIASCFYLQPHLGTSKRKMDLSGPIVLRDISEEVCQNKLGHERL